MNSPRQSIADGIGARINEKSAVVGVVGLGAVGSVSARLIHAAGFRVIGVDLSMKRVEELRSLPQYQCITIGIDPTALSDADVVMIAVRVETSDDGTDLRAARAAFRSLRQSLSKPALILFESTVPPGVTRQLTEECFGANSPQATLVAHCPERLRVGDDIRSIRATPRLVGGLTAHATTLGVQFLAQIGVTAVATSNPETTELSKLLENTFLTTGIALMGEVTRVAHRLGISAQEMAMAAATKPHGYFAFRPGAGIGGHCLINDLKMLRATASTLGVDSRLLAGVQHAADQLTATVVDKLEALLSKKGIHLGGALVCIVGVGFKPGSSDTTNTAAIELTRELRARGASVVYCDSLVPEFTVDGSALTRVSTPFDLEPVHAVLLLSGDLQVDLESAVARAPITLDAGGGLFVSKGARDRAAKL